MVSRKRKCKHCGSFVRNGIDVALYHFCNINHATAFARNQAQKRIKKQLLEQKKKERAEKRERKEKLRDRKWWLKKAQQLVNRYVNLRDHGKPCISCDRPFGTHKRNASHYRSVGACKALRYNLWNIHSSCVQCNKDKSGNILEYRIRLIRDHGEGRVLWLETQNGTPKYTIEYLEKLCRVFTKLIKRQNKRIMM